MSAPQSPSGDDSGAFAGAPIRLIVVVGAILVVRLVLAAQFPLTEDEAYYRLWAQAPALGYYDHPPVVAWAVWLGVRLLGDTSLGVRLAAIVASAITSLLVFDIARLAGGEPADNERAAVWYNCTFLVAAGGLLAVPDAFAALFWVLTLWALLRARRAPAVRWWWVAGAAAGLAALSKYSALFLGPGVLIWLISTSWGRARLRSPGPWVSLAIAASLFSLNVAWNAGHQWQTFIKQFGRITPHALAPRFLIDFLITEALLLNPLIAAFLIRALLRRGRLADDEPSVLPFLLTSAPFVGYLLFHSLHDRIQAHWPAPVYPAMAICAAFGARDARGGWVRLKTAVPVVALAGCAASAAYMSLPLFGIPLRPDPALAIRGWPAFSAAVETSRRRAGASWIATTSYGLTAQLLDERAIGAPVLQISERLRWSALPRGSSADTSRPGLLVDLQRRIDPTELARCFGQIRELGVLDRGPPGEKVKRYALYLVEQPRRDIVRDGCLGAAEPEP